MLQGSTTNLQVYACIARLSNHHILPVHLEFQTIKIQIILVYSPHLGKGEIIINGKKYCPKTGQLIIKNKRHDMLGRSSIKKAK